MTKPGSSYGRVAMERPQSKLLPRNYVACRGARGATSSIVVFGAQAGAARHDRPLAVWESNSYDTAILGDVVRGSDRQLFQRMRSSSSAFLAQQAVSSP